MTESSETPASPYSEGSDDSFGNLACAVCGHEWVGSWAGPFCLVDSVPCPECGAEAGGLAESW